MLYFYRKLPKNWAYTTKEMEVITETKQFKAYLNALTSNSINPGKIYIQGNPAPLIKEIVKQKTYKQVTGIDFKKYFDLKFNKNTDETVDIIFAKNTFIYNVGYEGALNTSYSSRLLSALINEAKQNNSWAVIISDLSYTDFYKAYGIKFVNTMVLPDVKEPKI